MLKVALDTATVLLRWLFRRAYYANGSNSPFSEEPQSAEKALYGKVTTEKHSVTNCSSYNETTTVASKLTEHRLVPTFGPL